MSFMMRRFPTVFATVVLTLVFTGAASALMTPTYESTATLRLATPLSGSINAVNYEVGYADRLMSTYVELATSEALLEELRTRSSLQTLPHIRVRTVPTTELITVTASATDPEIAARVANDLAALLVEQGHSHLASDATLQFLTGQLSRIEADLISARESYNDLAAEVQPESPAFEAAADAVTGLQETYLDLLSQIETRELLRSITLASTQTATPSAAPSSPRPLINLALGALLGLTAGGALAFWRDSTDPSVQSLQQLRAITALPVLGVFDLPRPRPWWLVHRDTGEEPASAFPAARQLSATLRRTHSPLMVTSVSAIAPSRNVASQLAQASATSRKTTVLVDTNHRAPFAQVEFGLDDGVGLTSVLDESVDFGKLPQPTVTEGLSVVAAGPSYPVVSVMDHPRVREFVMWLSTRFEIIVIDCPELTTSADPTVLSSQVNGTLVVVRLHETRRDDLQRALDHLKFIDARVTGLVVERPV